MRFTAAANISQTTNGLFVRTTHDGRLLSCATGKPVPLCETEPLLAQLSETERTTFNQGASIIDAYKREGFVRKIGAYIMPHAITDDVARCWHYGMYGNVVPVKHIVIINGSEVKVNRHEPTPKVTKYLRDTYRVGL